MNEKLTHPQVPEKPKFNPDCLDKAVLALKRGQAVPALILLEIAPEADNSLETAVNIIRRHQMRAEAHIIKSTVNSMQEAKAECRAGLALVSDLPLELRGIYEATLLCIFAEAERVNNGLSEFTAKELEGVVNLLKDGDIKNILIYYSQRTIGLSQIGNIGNAKGHIANSKEAHEKSQGKIPKDRILAIEDLGIVTTASIHQATPYPLSTLLA